MRVVPFVAIALVAAAVATAGNPPDPRQTKVVTTGPGPCGIAARAGTIWIGVYGTGDLLTLDATSGRMQSRTRVGRWACRVAVGPAAAWVTRDLAGEVVRVSRGTGRLRRVQVGRGAFDVLLANGSVWVSSHDTGLISRIDPRHGEDAPRLQGRTAPGGTYELRRSDLGRPRAEHDLAD